MIEGGRPNIPVEKATEIDHVRNHGGLHLGALNWFNISWRLEPIEFLMDWERGIEHNLSTKLESGAIY